MDILPIPMIAVAALIAIATVVVILPTPITAGPTIGVAFSNVVPIPVIAAAFAATIFVAVPATAGTIWRTKTLNQ